MADKIEIGNTGLKVNPIGFGANAVGGHNLYPDLDEDQNKELVRYVLDQGIDLIDTAYSYGYGRSEELLGEVIKETNKRQDIVLGTKGAQDLSSGEEVINNSPDFLRKTVDDSLKRLQTDYLDIFYIHNPDENTPKDEAVGALTDLKKEGKIRAVGVSNFSPEQLKEANKDGGVDLFQGYYNLLHRDAEKDFFPYVKENNISFVPFFPFQSGLLTGKYEGNESFDEDDLRAGMDDFQGQQFQNNVQKVNRLKTIADEKGVSVANLVLAAYLKEPAIDVLIPGAKRQDQVDSNLKTLDVQLTDEELKQIKNIFS